MKNANEQTQGYDTRTIRRGGTVDWTINVTEACQKRGIENAYQLWQKIGGSKGTTAQLFDGTSTMIKLETMNRLQSDLGITPFEYLSNVGTAR